MGEIAKLFVTIGAEYKDFQKGMAEVQSKLQDVSKKMTDIGESLSTKVTAPILGAGAAVIKFGIDFENGLAKVSTLFGDVDVSSDKLKKGLIGLSNELNVSTNVLAEGLYSALSAGVPVTEDMAEALAFMTQNAKLAKGGFTDVNTAVDTTTTILNAYGLAVDEVGRVSDILVNTQNEGKTTVGELGAALFNVVPTAAALGVEFEQVGASLATLTAQGTPTSVATTQMRQLFIELSKSGSKAADTFRELAGKSFKEYIAAGGTVSEATQLLSEHAKSAGLEIADMFGSVEAANAAMGLASEEGAAKFSKALETMETGAGATDVAFNKVADTTGEKFTAAFNKLKNSALAFFDIMAPMLEQVALAIDRVVTAFSSLSPATQRTILIVAAFAAAIGPVLIALGWLIGLVGSVIGLLPVLGAGLTFLLSPIGLIIIAIAALVAAGILLWQNWDTIKEKTLELWNGIKEAWNGIKATTEEVWNNIRTWLANLWQRIYIQAQQTWNNIKSFIFGVGTEITGVFNNLVNSAFNWGRNLITNFIDGIKAMWDGLIDTLDGIGDLVAGFLGFRSPTKYGPGRDADKWAPNLVEMFAKGIRANIPKIEAELNQMVAAPVPGLASVSNITNATNNPTTIVNIYTWDEAERMLARLGVRPA